MNSRNILSAGLTILLWGPVLFFSGLLSHNAILYFTHGGEYGILPEKAYALTDPVWKLCFYVHLPAGILCLFTPVIAFLSLYFRTMHRLHRAAGKVYVCITLMLICPTGMYLALYAKGGLVTQAGFIVQGLLLWFFTMKGLIAIGNLNIQDHKEFMIRSYAIAAAVLTFRIYHILFFMWKVPYIDNYALSQWLSLGGNAWLAEVIICFRLSVSNNKYYLNPDKI